jgi:hypothetical protein
MVDTPTAQASPRKGSGARGPDFVEVVIPDIAYLQCRASERFGTPSVVRIVIPLGR